MKYRGEEREREREREKDGAMYYNCSDRVCRFPFTKFACLLSAFPIRIMDVVKYLPFCCRPFIGMAMTLACACSYFATFRRTVILGRWCSFSENPSSCTWDVAHTSLVIFLVVNILCRYAMCAFLSPGFVVDGDEGSTASDAVPHHSICENDGGSDHDDIEDDIAVAARGRRRSFGGCCFLTSKFDAIAEGALCARYKERVLKEVVPSLCRTGDDQDGGDDDNTTATTHYHPSPWSSQCERCRMSRPARSHHCRVCRMCVLEYDHHW
jgi:hypothetical protein